MSLLKNVKRERLERPLAIVLMGTDGVGKSTFAAQAPEPIFLGAEEGTAQLEVARYPQKLTRWSDLFAALDTLEKEPHDFRTVVIDTVDWAEPMCWAHVCESNGWKSMDASPFNRAFHVAVDEWRRLVAKLDRLRELRKMHVVLVGHVVIRTFQNPEGDNYDRYQLKLHDKAASLLREWADDVLFASWETATVPKGDKGRAMGVSTGARVVHTERRAAYDAKNRHSLPPTLPLDWSAFEEAVKAGAVAPPAMLRAQIEARLTALEDDALGAKVRAHVARVGDDARKLAETLNKLIARQNQRESAAC